MDTSVFSHMIGENGNISKSYSSTMPYSQHIVVGNVSHLPNRGTRYTVLHNTPAFSLHNILYSPILVKNLILVQKFVKDNNCSIEFDSSGFSVKDLHSKKSILRSSSFGDLYTFFNTIKLQLWQTSPSLPPLICGTNGLAILERSYLLIQFPIPHFHTIIIEAHPQFATHVSWTSISGYHFLLHIFYLFAISNNSL